MTARRLAFLLLGLGLVVFPFVGSTTLIRTATLTLITIVAALGLNVLTGVAHQFSAGHAAFVAIGAYTAAYVMVDLELPYPFALLMAAVVAGAVGLVFAPVAFKLRHLGLALVTFGLVFVVQHVLRNVTSLGGGLRPKTVPDATLFGINLGQPSQFGPVTLTRPIQYYLLALVIAALAAWLVHNILRSRTGRNLSAMGDLATEQLAAHVGASTRRVKAQAFVLSSLLAGLAGGLLAPFVRVLQYESYGIEMSVEYLAIIVIGGLGSVTGSVLGAVFVITLRDVIRLIAPAMPFIADAGSTSGLTIAQATTLTYGLLIVLLLALRPDGLVSLLPRRRPQPVLMSTG